VRGCGPRNVRNPLTRAEAGFGATSPRWGEEEKRTAQDSYFTGTRDW
jgi:hypothetical protein